MADVNGDGRPDVVAVFRNSVGPAGAPLLPGNGTTVVLNLGGDAFSRIAVDESYETVAAADLDRDGKIDLFRGTTLLRGNGDGTFLAATPTDVPARDPQSSDLVDLTGDGRLDYVWSDVRGQLPITVYPGVGDGTFGAPATYLGPSGPAALADVDRDGRLDVVLPGASFVVKPAHCVK